MSADPIDRASETADLILQSALAAHKNSQTEGPKATGYCLYCQEKLDSPGQRWCDAECLHDWEDEQRRRQFHGK